MSIELQVIISCSLPIKKARKREREEWKNASTRNDCMTEANLSFYCIEVNAFLMHIYKSLQTQSHTQHNAHNIKLLQFDFSIQNRQFFEYIFSIFWLKSLLYCFKQLIIDVTKFDLSRRRKYFCLVKKIKLSSNDENNLLVRVKNIFPPFLNRQRRQTSRTNLPLYISECDAENVPLGNWLYRSINSFWVQPLRDYSFSGSSYWASSAFFVFASKCALILFTQAPTLYCN